MAVIINSVETHVIPGASLFDHAERVGITVPTSCNKQGKCRECIVEVTEGTQCLSERTAEERHLGARFRLSCRAIVRPEAPLPDGRASRSGSESSGRPSGSGAS